MDRKNDMQGRERVTSLLWSESEEEIALEQGELVQTHDVNLEGRVPETIVHIRCTINKTSIDKFSIQEHNITPVLCTSSQGDPKRLTSKDEKLSSTVLSEKL